jgi:cell wall-associated NlpC family hydrolase
VSSVIDAKDEPDLAQQVYQLLGVPNPGVSLRGDQTKVSELQPGDLIGWKGGHEPDGRYIGNIAMYVGPGEILESYYGTTRRRKLGPDENTFGMPVTLNEPGY